MFEWLGTRLNVDMLQINISSRDLVSLLTGERSNANSDCRL